MAPRSSRAVARRSCRSSLTTAPLLFLLLCVGAAGCINEPPPPGERVRSGWGSCAWRTNHLPTPTISAWHSDGVVSLTASVPDTGTQQADSILLYNFAAEVPASISEIPLSEGVGSGSHYIVVDPGGTVKFDARTVRRNMLGLFVCSYDVGPTDH